MLPASLLAPGRDVHLALANGGELRGRVSGCANGWLRLDTEQGDTLVNLAAVAVIHLGEGDGAEEAEVDAELPRPRPREAPRAAGPAAAGRAWDDAALRALVAGFLDHRGINELAAEHHRARHQVSLLHAAWQVARGDRTEDDVAPAAAAWVPRLRRVLAPG